jgi:hypothetical protein
MDPRDLQETIMTPYLVGLLALVGMLLVVRFAIAYVRLRGARVVTCPETQTQAGVELNAGKAAASAAVGLTSYRLAACSHWPERAGCGQMCLAEIQSSPVDCLVRTRLETWYEGQSCAICTRPIGRIDWYERRPALLAPDRQTLAWPDVDASHLDQILATHRPVCFDCHVAETFRRTHPELVLDNPYAEPPR